MAAKTDFEAFVAAAPAMNPNRFLIIGMICGQRQPHHILIVILESAQRLSGTASTTL